MFRTYLTEVFGNPSRLRTSTSRLRIDSQKSGLDYLPSSLSKRLTGRTRQVRWAVAAAELSERLRWLADRAAELAGANLGLTGGGRMLVR
jgi:hypothetical protein